MTELSRRAIIGGGLAIPVLGALGSGLLLPSAAYGGELAGPGLLPGLRSARSRPATVSSFGPNGTHFPTGLPWMGEAAATDIEVDCNWLAIGTAIAKLSAQQVSAGVIIRVRPGRLAGNGSGSSSRPVLQNVGSKSWTRNVLIVPRDGYGSVTIADAGIRFDLCNRISLFGISAENAGAVLTHCTNVQFGWSKWSELSITRSGQSVGLYEIVLGFRRNEKDSSGIRPTERYAMSSIYRYGCAFGPSVKRAGSKAHCDTLQVEGTGTGPFGAFVSVDTVDFGSSNAAILLHTRLSMAKFQHCMILAGLLPWKIFPLNSSDYQGKPNALVGGCRDVRVYDSIIAGPINSLGYTEVHNTTLSYQPQAKQQARRSGGWQVDTSIQNWDADDIYAQTGTTFDNAALARLWTW